MKIFWEENMIEIIKSQLENKEWEGLLSNVEDGEKKDYIRKIIILIYIYYNIKE